MITKAGARDRRHRRIRARAFGTAEKPRVVVHRSIIATYAQAMNDVTGTVIASVSDLKQRASGKPSERAKTVGAELGKKLVAQKITVIVFDRAGYTYHGRVKAVAEGLREAGIKF